MSLFFKGLPLTAANLASCLNFAQLASWAKFKQEPKDAAVKVDLLKTNAFSRLKNDLEDSQEKN